MIKKKADVFISAGKLVVAIPLELVTELLEPRIVFAKQTHFTDRENEVLRGIVGDLTNKEIAKQLNLSERTIKFHVSELIKKTGIKSRFGIQAEFAGVPMNGERK